MSRSASLRALLIATTVAGVSLPHLVAGEVAGSVPSLAVGMVAGVSCLALGSRSGHGRVVGTLGVAVVAVAPLIGYLAQETAEHESGVEAAHAEPGLMATIATQAPLIIVALVAVRLLVAAVRTVVRVLTRRVPLPRVARAPTLRAPALADLLRIPLAQLSSNGQRAPPFVPAPRRLAPLG